MAERRRQGLCYNCDEPYVQGHRCQRLFYLEVSDFDESEELDPEKDPENSELPPLISLHAITGIRPEETMQLRVNIGNHELTALLDSGSTHNFVSMEAARHIGLSFHDSKGKNVVVANGDRVACRGLARCRTLHCRIILHGGFLHNPTGLLRYGTRSIILAHSRPNLVGL